MSERIHDRVFAACGIASVVLMLAGVAIGATGGRSFATITSSPSEIAASVASTAGAAVWTGAYLEILSFGCFLAFAAWACARLGGGVLGTVGVAAATAYAALSLGALAVMDAIAYRSGHGIGLDLATTLVTLDEAIFVMTWFASAFFLLAVGPLAVAAGRRFLGWSAVGVAAIVLVLVPVSLDDLAQLANFLWLAWVVVASVALARERRVPAARLAGARA
jgi:hypothetical protein